MHLNPALICSALVAGAMLGFCTRYVFRLAQRRTRGRVDLHLSIRFGDTFITGKHMNINVSENLSQPITFGIKPTVSDGVTPAPVTKIQWSADVGTIVPAADGLTAVYTPAAAGAAVVTVSAVNVKGDSPSDTASVTVVDDVTPVATQLNLAVVG